MKTFLTLFLSLNLLGAVAMADVLQDFDGLGDNKDLYDTAKALLAGTSICSGLLACNPDFNISQIGLLTKWSPVKNLTFSGEVMYTYIDQKNVGVTPIGGFTLASEGTWTFGVRAQRNF